MGLGWFRGARSSRKTEANIPTAIVGVIGSKVLMKWLEESVSDEKGDDRNLSASFNSVSSASSKEDDDGANDARDAVTRIRVGTEFKVISWTSSKSKCVVNLRQFDKMNDENATVNRNFYKQCDGFILAFDVSMEHEFQMIRHYCKTIDHFIEGRLVSIAIVGIHANTDKPRVIQDKEVNDSQLREKGNYFFIDRGDREAIDTAILASIECYIQDVRKGHLRRRSSEADQCC
eukprot:g567.t1